MKKKCVVVAPPIPEGASIADGFRKCGWEAHLITFRAREKRLSTKIRSILRGSRRWKVTDELFDFVLGEVAIPLTLRIDAQILLVIRPEEISDQTRELLSKIRRPLGAWVIDSLDRYPHQKSLSEFTMADFLIDGGDVLESKHVWLPLGVDEDFLSKKAPVKDLDVLFIGNLEAPYYICRYERLMELIGSGLHKKYKCAAVVRAGNRIKECMLSLKTPFPITGQLCLRDYIKEISRARICINILQDDGKQLINPAFFLAPASRTCALVGKREYLSRWLMPDRHFVWFEEGRMTDNLKELLEDKDRVQSIALAGHEEIVSNHLCQHRAETIIKKLGLM
jgi:hypothetical protein